jgi:hypothetical protein
MRKPFRHGAVVATAILGLTAMAAVAAPPQGAKDPVTAPGAAAPATQQSMTARVDQRIKDLHSKLQITAAQEPEWQKFAQTMRDNAQKMDQAFESRIDQMQTMSAMDNMKSYAKLSEEHAQDVQALLPPFEALYASMSQSQKQTADQVFREDANRGAQAQHG